ncbi:MAG: serine/threonine protein kinase [Prevotella sp.]|nr:serine/threonine protein kinase [Prevotella sp.]
MQTLQKDSLLQGGKYRVKRTLGQGGFGITYEGIQEGLERRVAIKEFFMKDYCERDGDTHHVTVGTESQRETVSLYREKFIKEARMIASLDRAPHIVRIYDIFEENETAYYVMEFVEGGSLDALVKTGGPLPEARAFELTMQTAQALSSLHQRQTMHLDVKPANILLRKDEQGHDDVVLIDFGVSKHYDQKGHQTTTTPVGYSKGFAPLEQYREGGVQAFSPTTDIYSLGATLYFLLTGKAPTEATDLADEPLQRPTHISDCAWQVISRAMQSSRKQRYQSMEEMMDAMKNENQNQNENETLRYENENQKGNENENQNGNGNETVATKLAEESESSSTKMASPEKKKRRTWLWVLICLIPVIVIALILLNSKKDVEYLDKAVADIAVLFDSQEGYHDDYTDNSDEQMGEARVLLCEGSTTRDEVLDILEKIPSRMIYADDVDSQKDERFYIADDKDGKAKMLYTYVGRDDNTNNAIVLFRGAERSVYEEYASSYFKKAEAEPVEEAEAEEEDYEEEPYGSYNDSAYVDSLGYY